MRKMTSTEEEIMKIIWRIAPCTVSQILDEIEEARPPHSTISSVVRILEKKGFLSHKAYGRTYEYRPTISQEDYSKKSISQLVEDYFDGSFNQLVSFLVKEKDVDADEIRALISEEKPKEK
jgi:predicted transcriptional regulator